MSLTSAIQSGISGLAASQQALNVLSNNISNANVDGYTKKQVNNTTLLLGGQVAGVQVASITRNADDVFLKNMRGEISGLSRDEAIASFYGEIESIFGSTGDSVSLTASLTDLETRLQSLMTAPADNVQHSQIVSVAEDLTFQVRSSVAYIQEIRLRVDKEIESSIQTINDALAEIEKLNKDIGQASITDRPVGDLLDRRDQFLKQISEQMDVNTFTRPNDGLAIYTKSGQSLLEINATTLSYAATGNIKPESRYEEGNFGPIEVASTSLPTDLTDTIKSGKIAGLLQLRDTIFPELTDQLENLSHQLMSQMNQVHNAGVPYPPPSTLTSTRKISAADQFYATGTLRIAVMDAKGSYVDYLDVDLSTVTTPVLPATTYTYQDFVNYLNDPTTLSAVNGAAMNTYLDLSAPFNSDGTFSLKAKGNSKLAIGSPNPAAAPTEGVSGDGQTLQNYFGFNDFFVNTNTSLPPQNLRSTAAFDPNLAITTASGKLTFTLADSRGNHLSHLDYDLSGFSGETLSDLIADINADLSGASVGITVSLDSQNRLVMASNDQTQTVRIAQGTPAASVNGNPALPLLGLRDTRYSSASLDVRQTIKDQPQLLTRGRLNMPTITPPMTTPVVAIGQGDARNLAAINDMFLAKQSFDGTQKIGPRTLTLSEYASLILDYTARDIASAEQTFKNQSSLVTSLEATRSSVSDVNIDEEMAAMLVLQNAYNTMAQVVRVTNEMFDMLEQIV
jgi:flagellar hook-associated protein 1 FlgK